MKRLASALLLGALIWNTAAAHAATTIDTTGFSLRWLEGSGRDLDMRLLSASNGLVRIGMDAAPWGERWDTAWHGSDGGIGNGVTNLLAGSVREGYRITSMTLSAVVNGSLYLESRDCDNCSTTPGFANNTATLTWSVLRDGAATVLPAAYASHVEGSQPFAATTALALEGSFQLAIGTENTVEASSPILNVQELWGWVFHPLQATAEVRVADVTLSVQVTPVPEPSTYAMLAAGLAVAGWTAWRRQR